MRNSFTFISNANAQQRKTKYLGFLKICINFFLKLNKKETLEAFNLKYKDFDRLELFATTFWIS